MGRTRTRARRAGTARWVSLALATAGLAVLPLAAAPGATGATGDVGTEGPVYGAPVNVANPNDAPTASKPQSKLWYVAGTNTWFGVLLDSKTKATHIFRYDTANDVWRDTGVLVDAREKSRADVLWDGKNLFVVSASPLNTTTTPGSTADAIRFSRYSYDKATQTFSRQTSYNKTLNSVGVEAVVLTKDTLNRIWVTWVNNLNEVKYRVGANGGATWSPKLGLTGIPESTGLHVDDLSSVVANNNGVSLVWSKQEPAPTTGPQQSSFYVARHEDGTPVDAGWSVTTLVSGLDVADDHINLSVDGDASGRVFLAVKTAADHNQPPTPSADLIQLWVLSGGTVQKLRVSTAAEHQTRPIVVVDHDAGLLRVFTTSSDAGGFINERSTSLAQPADFTGPLTPFIKLASDPHVNNATTTKQNVTKGTGLMVLASDQSTGRYAYNGTSIPLPDPAAHFTAASGPQVGQVTFTNTSTDAVSYVWNFGDGTATSTLAAPVHTYAKAGSYTVTLTAANRRGVISTTTLTAVARTTAGPVARMTAPRARWTTSRRVSARWTSSATAVAARTYDVQRAGASVTGALSTYRALWTRTLRTTGAFRGAPGATYCLRARGTHVSGVSGSFSAPRCTAVPLDDRNLRRAGAWRAVSSRGSYLGTVLRATARRATLSRTVRTSHVALVATTGRGMGTVAVYRGSRLLKRINLAGPTTRKLRFLPVADFARPTRGTIRVVVTSRGRPVYVDGLAVAAR